MFLETTVKLWLESQCLTFLQWSKWVNSHKNDAQKDENNIIRKNTKLPLHIIIINCIGTCFVILELHLVTVLDLPVIGLYMSVSPGTVGLHWHSLSVSQYGSYSAAYTPFKRTLSSVGIHPSMSPTVWSISSLFRVFVNVCTPPPFVTIVSASAFRSQPSSPLSSASSISILQHYL